MAAAGEYGDEAAGVGKQGDARNRNTALGETETKPEWGDPLPDDWLVFRSGGNEIENLKMNTRERKITDEIGPGISVLAEKTPEDAMEAMLAAFSDPRYTRLQKQAEVQAGASARGIRAAGYDVIWNPSKRLPSHARVVHPEGVDAFHLPDNLRKLQEAFSEILWTKP